MPIIKNVCPYGELDVPLLGVFLDADEEIEVKDDVARRLLPQAENYAPVDAAARAIADEIFGVPESAGETPANKPDTDGGTEPDPVPPATTRRRRKSGS